MKRALIATALALLILTAVLLIRASNFGIPPGSAPAGVPHALAEDETLQRLAQALAFRTIAYEDRDRVDWAQFEAFHEFLAERFPAAHQAMGLEKIDGHGLLYTWQGREPGLPPILLLAHQDVVPAAPDSLEAWTHPPFAGTIEDGYVWGRGALDDKASLLAILEAVETLIGEGFVPRRAVLLAFGQDEEVGGQRGAVEIAKTLRARGVRPLFILDEGGIVAEDMIPGVKGAVALIGVAEKGVAYLRLSAKGEGGHASMPPRRTAVGVVSAAVAKLETNPGPADTRYIADLMRYVSHDLPLSQRVVFANLWLFNPLLKRQLSKSRQMNAMIRTTTAPTMFSGSIKANVLPDTAQAVVNLRILPGDTAEQIKQRAIRAIDDPRVSVEIVRASDPSPVSSADTASFHALRDAVFQALDREDLVVAPYLTVGATDARHYAGLSQQVYRFLPIALDPEELKGMHGLNERISAKNYLNMIRFYRQLLRNAEDL